MMYFVCLPVYLTRCVGYDGSPSPLRAILVLTLSTVVGA